MSKQEDIAAAKALLAKAEAEVEVAASAPVVVPVSDTVVAEDTDWLDAPPRLDVSRPYGTVHDGSGVSKARYQQDGKFYGHDGALIKE